MSQLTATQPTLTQQNLVDKLQAKWESAIESVTVFRGELTINVELEKLYEILENLRKEHKMAMLLDISSVDHLHDIPRFEVVYELATLNDRQHIRVKTSVAQDQSVPTVVTIWKTANWHEREIFDMMGIKFSDHPEMTRILMWEGYEHYPLRKDFPLAGIESEIPDANFSADKAPLEGGPFVTNPGAKSRVDAEPCAKGES